MQLARLTRWATPIAWIAITVTGLVELRRLRSHGHDSEALYGHLEEHYPTREEVEDAIAAQIATHSEDMHPDTKAADVMPDVSEYRELGGH